MTHADLDRRIDEVLGVWIDAPNLVHRLNRALERAGLPKRFDTLSRPEVDALTEHEVAVALEYLSAYGDADAIRRKAADLAARKAS